MAHIGKKSGFGFIGRLGSVKRRFQGVLQGKASLYFILLDPVFRVSGFLFQLQL